jgi:hypothetical protein
VGKTVLATTMMAEFSGWTVLLSVIAHGLAANPLVRRIAERSAELSA